MKEQDRELLTTRSGLRELLGLTQIKLIAHLLPLLTFAVSKGRLGQLLIVATNEDKPFSRVPPTVSITDLGRQEMLERMGVGVDYLVLVEE